MILSALCTLALLPAQEPELVPAAGHELELAPKLTAVSHVIEGQADPRFDVIVLANAVASEVSPVLESLLGEGDEVMADPRTNSLLVMVDPETLPKVKRVIAEIDMPATGEPPLDDLFPMPSGDLMIAADSAGSMTISSLVNEYARLTDQHFVINPDTMTYLEQQRTGLSRSVVVPKAEVQSFFEEILMQNHFVMQVLREEAPRLLSVQSLNTGSRTTLRQDAIFVSPEDLPRYARHSAILITTVIDLPNTDVRQLSNSMRTMITDANTQQMLPAGNTSTMVLTGFAASVVPMARMLRIVDEASTVESVEPMYRRYALKFAKAAEVAGAIEDLVNSSSRRSAGAQPQGPPVANARRGHADARVMIDARTNALVVMAMPYDMESIDALVKLFDVQQ